MYSLKHILRFSEELAALIDETVGRNERGMRVHCALTLLMTEATEPFQVTPDQKRLALCKATRWDTEKRPGTPEPKRPA